MHRHTPVAAIVLSPVALFALMALWKSALLPLSGSIWHSDTALHWRLASLDPQTRAAALRAATSRHPADDALLDRMLTIMDTDPLPNVRAAAAKAIGGIGHRQRLPDKVTQALAGVVLAEQDDAVLSAAVEAVGQSASHNQYPDQVVQRLASVLEEEHLPWVYNSAARSLGHIGAAQTMPDEVFDLMNALFADTERKGVREDIAGSFALIAAARPLPTATLELLADALEQDPNGRVRTQAIYALAHAGADYPPSKGLIEDAAQDASHQLRQAAQTGLRIMENKPYADLEPMSLALDQNLPVEARLNAIPRLKQKREDAAWRQQVISLLNDEEPRVVVAALELVPFVAGAPTESFDSEVLIPRLGAAMSDPDPELRAAAFGALSRLLAHNHGYRNLTPELRSQLAIGAEDPVAEVRVVALTAMLRAEPEAEERGAILHRGLSDTDPYVRRMATGWIGYRDSDAEKTLEMFARMQQDSDESVRKAALDAQQKWESLQREWPKRLAQLWQSGEYTKLGLLGLTFVTVLTPIVTGFIFLMYFTARFLTYLYQKRWRALAVAPVMAIWAGASYGMFMLYFMAAHASNPNTAETLQLAGILWLAIALYGALGWVLHFVIRR